MNSKTKGAAPAASGVHTSAQDETTAAVHTSAQPAEAAGCSGCGNCGGKCQEKPAHHRPSQIPPRDALTGVAGSFVRDPATGERKPAQAPKD